VSGAGVVRRTLVVALVLAAAQLVPINAAHAQRRADARLAFAPALRAHVTHAPVATVREKPDHTTRTGLSVIIGGTVGAVLGYYAVKSACVSCTDNAPKYLGGTIGALGGAAVGLMLARSRDDM
jgi:hypothetical protein